MKKILKIILLTILAVVAISIFSNVEAATASIKTSKTSATVGESVTITVNINAAAWNLKATGPGISGGNFVGYTQDTKNASRTETLKLDTSTAGTKTIVLSGDVTDENESINYINSTVTIEVKEKTNSSNTNNSNNNTSNKKSSDASLKSVTVGGKNYAIGKTMTVGADTSSVTIKATANSSKATVSGTGRKELVTGTNKFTIKVTAEDGTSKSYTVTVIREEPVEDVPNIIEPTDEQKTQDLRLTSLTIEGVELIPEFNSETFEYSVYITDLEELKIDAVANLEGANIEITGNTGLIEGENVATIKLTKDDKVTEYKITINKTVAAVLSAEPEENIISQEENLEEKVGFIGMVKDWWNRSGPITLTFTAILIFLGIAVIFAIVSYKYSNGAREASRHGRISFIQEENDMSNKKE